MTRKDGFVKASIVCLKHIYNTHFKIVKICRIIIGDFFL